MNLYDQEERETADFIVRKKKTQDKSSVLRRKKHTRELAADAYFSLVLLSLPLLFFSSQAEEQIASLQEQLQDFRFYHKTQRTIARSGHQAEIESGVSFDVFRSGLHPTEP